MRRTNAISSSSSFVLILRAQLRLCTQCAYQWRWCDATINSHTFSMFSVNFSVWYTRRRVSHAHRLRLAPITLTESIVSACARLTGHLNSVRAAVCYRWRRVAICARARSTDVHLHCSYGVCVCVCALFTWKTCTAHRAHNWHSTLCTENTVVDFYFHFLWYAHMQLYTHSLT